MKVTLLRQSAVVWGFLYYPGKRANDKIKHVQCISLSILYINRLKKYKTSSDVQEIYKYIPVHSLINKGEINRQ